MAQHPVRRAGRHPLRSDNSQRPWPGRLGGSALVGGPGHAAVRCRVMTEKPEPKDAAEDEANAVGDPDKLRNPPDDTAWIEMEEIRGGDWSELFGGEID